MMYPYMTLNDDTEIMHSEMYPDGKVKVYIETPDETGGFHDAICWLPDYTWEVHGYSESEMMYFKQLIRDNAHLIIEFSQEGGILNAANIQSWAIQYLSLRSILQNCGGRLRTTPKRVGCVWFSFFVLQDQGLNRRYGVSQGLLATTIEIYESESAFAEDVIKAYVEFVNEIYAAGCRNLQFDDCVWGGMVNQKTAVALTGRSGEELEEYKKLLLKLNNEVVAAALEDLLINTHVCRGNYHSTFFSSGAYDSVAELLFGEENVNAYYLEYDDERSGGFAPLAKVTGDKKVVLGLVTTKTPELEDREKVINRIHQAAKYIPLDRLYLSPQCGFASCEIGNKLTEEEQWEKLRLVKEIAEEVWG